MGDLAGLVLQREVVIGLAVLGALVAMSGPLVFGSEGEAARRRARWSVRAGYAITGLSVLLFIVAGFVG